MVAEYNWTSLKHYFSLGYILCEKDEQLSILFDYFVELFTI